MGSAAPQPARPALHWATSHSRSMAPGPELAATWPILPSGTIARRHWSTPAPARPSVTNRCNRGRLQRAGQCAGCQRLWFQQPRECPKFRRPGRGSVEDQANSVSIGSSGFERRITNPAQGTAATDAINLAQLNAAVAAAGNGLCRRAQRRPRWNAVNAFADGDYSTATGTPALLRPTAAPQPEITAKPQASAALQRVSKRRLATNGT